MREISAACPRLGSVRLFLEIGLLPLASELLSDIDRPAHALNSAALALLVALSRCRLRQNYLTFLRGASQTGKPLPHLGKLGDSLRHLTMLHLDRADGFWFNRHYLWSLKGERLRRTLPVLSYVWIEPRR